MTLEQRLLSLAGDKCERAVLEFTGRIGLGMDITDFLELERAFKRERVMQAAP